MAWMCPQCGSLSSHYNRERMRYECDGCGTPVMEEWQEERQLRYHRTMFQAKDHLRAGNWRQVLSMLGPLAEQNPTDKRLYQMMIRAATQDYQDMRMKEMGIRSTASWAWEKLKRLHGLEERLIRYGQRSFQACMERLKKRRNHILIWCAIFGVCFLLFPYILNQDHVEEGMFLLVLWGISIYRIITLQPLTLLQIWPTKPPAPTDNPFAREELKDVRLFFSRN